MTVAPLILRLTVGLTFLWAGLGKFNAYDPVAGEDAARLANVEALERPKAQAKDHDTATDEPSKLMYSAADFPQEVRARRMHTDVTLRILRAAEPKEVGGGQPPRSIWPATAAGSKAVLLAWIVSVTDVAGGLCVLLGLLTRLWSVVLAGHMAVGMWLMVIGPAWQGGDAVLGFIPRHDPWDVSFWLMPLWILSLLAMNLALALIGAGSMSLDRPLLGEAVRPPVRPNA